MAMWVPIPCKWCNTHQGAHPTSFPRSPQNLLSVGLKKSHTKLDISKNDNIWIFINLSDWSIKFYWTTLIRDDRTRSASSGNARNHLPSRISEGRTYQREAEGTSTTYPSEVARRLDDGDWRKHMYGTWDGHWTLGEELAECFSERRMRRSPRR